MSQSRTRLKLILRVIAQLILLIPIVVMSKTVLTAEPYFNFDYIDEESGLANSSVEVIAQDGEGYIWFGTHNGVFKFDGFKSQKFLRDGKPGSLLGADIFDILITSNDSLWVATASAGIAKYDKSTNTFSHITDTTEPYGLAHFRAKKLLEFGNKIWVLTDKGIEALDQATLESERIALVTEEGVELLDYTVKDLVPYNNSILTVYKDRVYRFNTSKQHFDPYDFSGYKSDTYSSDSDHFNIYFGSENKLFLYTQRGLFQVDLTNSVIRLEPLVVSYEKTERLNIRDILVDSHETIWISTLSKGLHYRFSASDFFSEMPHGIGVNQLNTLFLYDLFLDRTHNLWLGTDGAYAVKFRIPQAGFPYYSNYYQRSDTIHTYSIWTFLEHADRMFLGTDTGVYTLGGGKGNFKIKPLLISENFNRTYALLPVKESVYIGTNNGLFEYLPNGEIHNRTDYISNNIAVTNLANEYPSVVQLAQSSTHLFIGTFFGLVIIDKQTLEGITYSTTDKNHKLKDDWVLVMKYDEKNQLLWIGSSIGSEVVSVGNKQSVSELNRMLDQIPDTVNDFYFDDNGAVWIASSLGLYRYTEEGLLLEYSSFPDNNISAIQIVDDRLWMTVNSGLITAPINNLQDYQYYIREDGLYNSTNMAASAFYSRKMNQLYFGGDRGFVAFSPKIILPKSKMLLPSLQSVNLLNVEGQQDITQKILLEEILDYDENSLRFNFTYLDFKAPKKNRFQYKLEGFDSNWSVLSPERAATYTNLNAGDYLFRVRAYNANNVLSEKELSVAFTVKKAWWWSGFAIFLYVLSALFSVYFSWRLLQSIQNRKLHLEQQRNKEEFIHGYNRYALSLAKLSSYQTLVRKFLDQVKLITGAEFLGYYQFLNESPFEITVGELKDKNNNLKKLELISNNTVAQLSIRLASDEIMQKTASDIQILFQQMVILQASLLDKQRYNWNDYFTSTTGLYNRDTFLKVVSDEFERAKKNKSSVVLFEWFIDKSRFRDNELLKRIQLLSYGDQVKYVFGQHVIATYLERDLQKPKFLIYLSELNPGVCKQYEENLLKVINENQLTNVAESAKYEKINIIHLDSGFNAFLSNLVRQK